MPDAEFLAHTFARAMASAGARTVFGLPGGGNNLEIVGALRAQGLQFVLTHGETSAAIMAAVYADVAGVPSAAVVTRGPGATSAVNGAAQALLDRQPMLLLTDAVPEKQRSRVLHQLVDQPSVFRPVTKGTGVLGPSDPDATMAKALQLALTRPCGPVHLDFDPTSSAPPGVTSNVRHQISGTVDEMATIRALVAKARCPVVLLGVGARHATAEVRSLLEGRDVPVLTTYRAKGVIPESWSCYAGLLTGATVEAEALDSADLLLAIGVDSVELIPAGWPYRAPLVSLSAWAEASCYLPAAHSLVGDLPELVLGLSDELNGNWGPGRGQGFLRRGLDVLLREPESLRGVSPQQLVRAMRAQAPAGTIATVDSGAHMLAALPLWEAAARDEAIVSSGLATMGFAVPAAIGAALAAPGRRIVAFVGDGGLGMTLAELETLARLRLPVTVVVFNDSRLSLIGAKQSSPRHGGEAAVAYLDTDFGLVAAGFGIPSQVVSQNAHLDGAVAECLASPGPTLLDARVDPACYPLILNAIRGPRRPADGAPRPWQGGGDVNA